MTIRLVSNDQQKLSKNIIMTIEKTIKKTIQKTIEKTIENTKKDNLKDYQKLSDDYPITIQ